MRYMVVWINKSWFFIFFMVFILVLDDRSFLTIEVCFICEVIYKGVVWFCKIIENLLLEYLILLLKKIYKILDNFKWYDFF